MPINSVVIPSVIKKSYLRTFTSNSRDSSEKKQPLIRHVLPANAMMNVSPVKEERLLVKIPEAIAIRVEE